MKRKKRVAQSNRTTSDQTASPSRSPNRVGLVLGVGLVAIAVAWFLSPRLFHSATPRVGIEFDEAPLAPGEPPLDAAALLELSPELPKTAEQFNAESLAVGKRLVRSIPDRPESHAQLAFANLQIGQGHAALDAWRAALAVDDRFADAHLGIGVIFEEQGDNEAAIAAYRRAIELAPQSEAAYRELVEVLLRVGRTDEALPVAQQCVRRFPDVPEHHFWLGQVNLELGDFEAAVRSHEQAIRIDPDFPLSYFPLARACARLGRHEDADRYRQRFAELRGAELQADRERTIAYDDLATQRQRLVKRHVLAGTLHLQYGDLRMAEAHWLRAAAIDPQDSATRKALASLYQNQNRPGAEVRFLDQLTRLEPAVADHALRRGRLLMEMHQWPEAEQVLAAFVEGQPGSADVHLLLAQLCWRRGRNEEAAAHAERAVGLAASVPGFLLLASIREQSGDRPGAIAALKQALALEPGNTGIRETYEQLSSGRRR